MLVTHEMDYAVRIVRALTQKGQLSASAVAQREGMHQAVTYKVLKQLARAGIVESRRGADGGYFLKHPASELTLYDLFHALGECMLLTQCLEPGHCCENNAQDGCTVHREFARIQQVLEQELKRTPLSTLLGLPPNPS